MTKSGTKTIVKSIRMPAELLDRINVLAKKRMTNVNHWIVRTLEREAKIRREAVQSIRDGV